MKKLNSYRNEIRKLLKGRNVYSKSLEPQIEALASAMRTLDVANKEIDKLETTTVETPQGLKAHPAFKVRKDAADSVINATKALEASVKKVEADQDTFYDFMAEVNGDG